MMIVSSDGAAGVVLLPRRESLPSLVGDSQICWSRPAHTKIQAAATIATTACCSPQNAVNMDYLSNCASEKSSHSDASRHCLGIRVLPG